MINFVIFTLCLSLIIITIFGLINYFESEDTKFISYISAIIIVMICVSIVNLIEIEIQPKAMDVYKGETQIEYKGYYRDSLFIKTDSIVIYKLPSDTSNL